MRENVDQEEINKFAALATQWWDANGTLKTLHQINPLRLSYIKEKTPLINKTVIDIGCGGGILTESLADASAIVTGIDMNKPVLSVAKLHLHESGVGDIHYEHCTAESFAERHPASFDIVTCLEMLEHVPDPPSIVNACAALVKPGGHVFFSTLNRNPKSYLFAILGAEYLLKLLPKNTHDYAKFIRPSELTTWAKTAGLTPNEVRGITYNPLTQQFKLSNDISVNYLFYATKPI